MSDIPAACPVCLASNTTPLREYRSQHQLPLFSQRGVFQCQDCGLGFAHPMPDQDSLNHYYAQDYRAIRNRTVVSNHPWGAAAARARSQAAFIHNAAQVTRCLDIGAGFGLLLDELKRQGVTTAAVEPDLKAREHLRNQGHQLLDALDGSWDLIAMSHLLEHVPQPREFLASVKQHLEQGAYVFCEVPNEARLIQAKDDVPHLLFFQAESLRRLFEACGFRVLALRSCGSTWGRSSPLDGSAGQIIRAAGARLFARPPAALDRLVFRHYRYSDHFDRKWLRLLAIT
jgi:SAM-dependent methyltransferase